MCLNVLKCAISDPEWWFVGIGMSENMYLILVT